MKKVKLLLSLSILFFALYSCNEQLEVQGLESTESIDSKKPVTKPHETLMDGTDVDYCGEPVECTLIAGQHIDAGTVTVRNDATHLYVEVYSKAGFQNVEENIKMWIGTELPKKRPPAGHFPYKVTESSNTHTFKIELSTIDAWNGECGEESDPFYIVVHADVLTESGSAETAFGGCEEGTGKGAWWYYMEYAIECCEEEEECMDVFARKDVLGYFDCLDVDIDGNTIPGWSSKILYSWMLSDLDNGTYHDLPIRMINDENCEDLSGRIGYVEILAAENRMDLKIRYIIFSNNDLEISDINIYTGIEQDRFLNFYEPTPNLNEEGKVSEYFTIPWSGDPSSWVYITAHTKVCLSK